MAYTVDAVVVGAGLSGLRAAVELDRAGLTYVVLEAMDRVGGRTLSVPSHSLQPEGLVELGAAWINDSNQSEMYALAKEFGFKLVQQRAEGDSLYQDIKGNVVSFPYGLPSPLTDKDELDFHRFIETFNGYVERTNPEQPHLGPDALELDSMSAGDFAERILGGGIASTMSNSLTRAPLGVENHEVSALFLVDFVRSGWEIRKTTDSTCETGMSFAIGLASKLKKDSIRLSSPVQSISQTGGHCSTKTQTGTCYDSKRVIVSVPSNVYSSIQFQPSLPPSKQALSKLYMGYYAKTIFLFATAWWRDANLSGCFSSDDGPITFTRDTCVPECGQFSITCFHAGDPGRRLSRLSPPERRSAVWTQFCAVFGTVVSPVPEPINIIEKHWAEERWIQGNPIPVMGPRLLTSEVGSSLWKPFGHIFFVGAETSLVWKGYMEGAVRAGAQGAREVIAQLGGAPKL